MHLLRGVLFGLGAAIASVASAQAQLDLKARDAAMSRGSVTYTLHQTIDGKAYVEPTQLVYNSKRQFLERIDNAARLGCISVTFLQSKGNSLMERKAPGDDTVTVGGFLPRNDSPMFYIVDKPSLPLAGGLSNLRNPKITNVPGGLILTGKLPDKTDMRVVYGKLLEYGIPDHMERSAKGRLFNTWDMTGAVPAGPSLWVPQHVIAKTATTSKNFTRTFDISKADFSAEPSESDLTYKWFRPGVFVRDESTRPPTMWTYDELLRANGGSAQLDFKALANLTNQSLMAQKSGRHRDPVTVAIFSTLSLVTVSLMSAFVYRLRRRGA